MKILSVEYRRQKNKSPYKFFLGFRIGYSNEYVNWLIEGINKSYELGKHDGADLVADAYATR